MLSFAVTPDHTFTVRNSQLQPQGAAQLGAAQVGAQGAAQVGAQLLIEQDDTQQELAPQQPWLRRNILRTQRLARLQQLSLRPQLLHPQPLLQPLLQPVSQPQLGAGAQHEGATGAQQEGAGAAQVGAGAQAGAAHVGAGAQQVGAGAQQVGAGAQHVGAGAQQVGAGAQHVGAGAQQVGAGAQQDGAPQGSQQRLRLNKPASAAVVAAKQIIIAEIPISHFISGVS